ncbi:MAG: hypothetical protein M1829_002855 [Trizodia sp. TS-e1964]|nr:MAG: hypothetical protein M1829_002855 [Trizodia sp. TS-e1964]
MTTKAKNQITATIPPPAQQQQQQQQQQRQALLLPALSRALHSTALLARSPALREKARAVAELSGPGMSTLAPEMSKLRAGLWGGLVGVLERAGVGTIDGEERGGGGGGDGMGFGAEMLFEEGEEAEGMLLDGGGEVGVVRGVSSSSSSSSFSSASASSRLGREGSPFCPLEGEGGCESFLFDE